METTDERKADERMADEHLEVAMVAWARRRADENGSQLARDLEVGQATISRWNNSGATTLTERLRERVTAYWEEHGIVLGTEAPADGVNAPANDVNAAMAGEMDAEGGKDATSGDDSSPGDLAPPKEGESASERELISPIPLSVLPRVERATNSEEIARETGIPVLALLDVEAARAAAQELAAGWQWKGNTPPKGVHGDALLYMHTREEVVFRDEGAKTVAFAPNTHRFACGLTAAEMRFGIDPRLRQASCAVREHWKRPLLIGTRLAGLIPAARYEDEDWFFGSGGRSRHGKVQASAAELVARRRVLQEMVWAFERPKAGLGSRLWLVASVELLEVEATLLGPDYELTFGEQVIGNRTWPPSTRLGIETDWRVAEIGHLEARLSPGLVGGLLRGLSIAYRLTGRLALSIPASLVQSLARRVLRRRGLWDAIYDSPHRRAAVVVRSGGRPSRRSIWAYTWLRRVAGISVLAGQFCGQREWQATAPPWSEAHHRRFRAERIPERYTPDWLPYEFDDEYNLLPHREVKTPKQRGTTSKLRRRTGLSLLRTVVIRLSFTGSLTRTRPVEPPVKRNE